MEFETRFVGLLDVLGFREIAPHREELERVYEAVIDHTGEIVTDEKDHGIYPSDPIEVTVLSDTIVLSIPVGTGLYEGYKRLRYLLSAIEKLQFQCATQNIWMRGGVSWGELHHAANVLGEGLVKAYRIEQTAKYPRVILDPAIIPGFFVPLDGPSNRVQLRENLNHSFGAQGYSGRFLFDPSCMTTAYQAHFTDDVALFVHYMNSIYSTDVTDAVRDALVAGLRKQLYGARSREIYAKYKWVVEYLISIAPGGIATDSGLLGELLQL